MILSKVQWVLAAVIAGTLVWASALQSGCTTPEQLAAFKRNADQSMQQVNSADAEVKRLQDEKFGLQEALDTANAQLQETRQQHDAMQAELQHQLEQAQNEAEKARLQQMIADREDAMKNAEAVVAKAEAKVDEFTAKINETLAAKDEALKAANDWNAKIQQAQNPGDVIQATGTAIAPVAGPYAPFVLLGTNLLSAIAAGIWQRRSTGSSIVSPLESARNRALEDKVNAESGATGAKYMVVDQRAVGAAHAAAGVTQLIKSLTN